MLSALLAQTSDIAGTDLVEGHRVLGASVIAIAAALVCALVAKWPRRPRPDYDRPVLSAVQFIISLVVPIFAMLLSVLTMLNGLLLVIWKTNGPSALPELAITSLTLSIFLFLTYFIGTALTSKAASGQS